MIRPPPSSALLPYTTLFRSTLSFGATGLTPATAAITLSAGAAAAMTANSPTTQSAPAGSAVGSPPSVIVRDGAGNPGPGVAVTLPQAQWHRTGQPTTPPANRA